MRIFSRVAKGQKAVLVALIFCSLVLSVTDFLSAAPRPQMNQGSGYLGTWCAQGIPSKQASISSNGVFFNLTNESGSTSTGHMQGNTLVAEGWQFVQGNLSPDGTQINWSNGTMWARCNTGGGGGGRRPPNVDGTWYQSGNHSLPCYIHQRGKNLNLTNESNSAATGSFDSKRHITTNWGGTMIGGTLTSNGNRINWDNGTYWTR